MAEDTGTPDAASQGEPAADAPATDALLHPSADDVAKPADDTPADDKADDKPADDKADDKPADDDKKDEKSDDDKSKDISTEFTMPEGMELDTEAAAAFAPLAQELGLDQDGAQKLVDFYATNKAAAEKASVDAWEKTQTDWQEAVKSDPEVGGTALDENLGVATKALEKFGNSALNDAILATGMGNNVEFIRFAYKVGKAMSEDNIGTGSPTVSTELDRAKILFPDQN